LASVLDALRQLRSELSRGGRLDDALGVAAVSARYGCDARTARKAMRATGVAFRVAGRLHVHRSQLVAFELDLAAQEQRQATPAPTARASRKRERAADLSSGWWQ
jgi:hypothetical protein